MRTYCENKLFFLDETYSVLGVNYLTIHNDVV